MVVFTKVLLLLVAGKNKFDDSCPSHIHATGFVITAYAQSTQCRYFEERNGKAIIDNQPLVYVCSIKSSSSVPTIIWNGSSFADCPDERRIIQIGPGPSLDEYCGSFSANASTIGDCYTSVLSFTASPELNGTVIQCTDNDERVKVGSATIIIGMFCVCVCVCVCVFFYLRGRGGGGWKCTTCGCTCVSYVSVLDLPVHSHPIFIYQYCDLYVGMRVVEMF